MVSLGQNQGVCKVELPPEALGKICFLLLQWLVAASVPWFVTTSLQWLVVTWPLLFPYACEFPSTSLLSGGIRLHLGVSWIVPDNLSTLRFLITFACKVPYCHIKYICRVQGSGILCRSGDIFWATTVISASLTRTGEPLTRSSALSAQKSPCVGPALCFLMTLFCVPLPTLRVTPEHSSQRTGDRRNC